MFEEKKQFYFAIFCYLSSFALKLWFIKWICQYLGCIAPMIWMNMNMELCQNDDWQVLLITTLSTTNLSLSWDWTQESIEEVAADPQRYCTPLYRVVNCLLIAAIHKVLSRMQWMHIHKISWWMMSWYSILKAFVPRLLNIQSSLSLKDYSKHLTYSVCVVEQPVAWTNSSSVVCCIACYLLHTTKHTHLSSGIFSWAVICMGIVSPLHLI
jgi:hypothetical protein